MIDTISITDLKQNTAQVMKQVKSSKRPLVIMQRSKPTGVILDPEEYEKMMEMLEDLEDLRAIEERKDEPTVPFDEYFEKRFSKSLKVKK